MIKMRVSLLGCLIFWASSATYAQVKTLSYKSDFFEGSTSLTSVRLNSSSIAFVSNDNDKAVEIICTDNNSNKKWSARADGYLHKATVLGKNLLILVSTEFTFFTRSNSIFKAYLINSDNGKIMESKILYTGNNEYHTFPYVLISKDYKTLTIATRETALKRNVKIGLGTIGAMYTIKKTIDQGNTIKSFNVLTFDENLKEKGAISPDLPAGDFIGIQRTINNDLYIAVSENRKGITISKYLPDTEKSIKSVTEPFSYYGGLLSTGHLNDYISFFADTITNNAVYISGSFKTGDEYITMLNKYDFTTDKHKRFKKSFTKDELKAMEKSFVPVNKEFKKLSLGSAKNFELLKVAIHDEGYFLLISDDSMTAPGQYAPAMPYSEGIIVYNLDPDLKTRTVSTIPRYFVGPPKPCLNVYARENALYVMASSGSHAKFITARLNFISGKLEDIQTTEPDKVDRSCYASLNSAIFSEKGMILPILDYKMAFGKVKFDVHLSQLGW